MKSICSYSFEYKLRCRHINYQLVDTKIILTTLFVGEVTVDNYFLSNCLLMHSLMLPLVKLQEFIPAS